MPKKGILLYRDSKQNNKCCFYETISLILVLFVFHLFTQLSQHGTTIFSLYVIFIHEL